ncbi:cell wall-binding repeat-containing protein [Clostridium cochlearium]|uniref:Cell wall-binding repeat-containing protein n=1 Tax=Clostridium cochlearium TaxID=1494 RepID=A0A7Y3XYK2_CLOCO|nr:cell wall-binding repeat-containing protein [Clostridium cochlearium]NOH16227.1 cell wall-binding repeat-containing protein [Clostridium cochlearium]
MKRNFIIALIASLLLTSFTSLGKVQASNVSHERYWGKDRYETSIKISQKGWESGAKYVVLASGQGYADALSSAPFANFIDAPILLTKGDKLEEKTLQEIKRLDPSRVYIIGGEGSISEHVEDEIKSKITNDVERFKGGDRYETSMKIAQRLPNKEKVILASGEGYADALSAAPIAAINSMPIVLIPRDRLPKLAEDYLKKDEVKLVYIIGGTASISDTIEKKLPSSIRIYGKDRFETNAEIIRKFPLDFDYKNAYITLGAGETGNEFADALTGSVLAAKDRAPVLLTGKNLNSNTKAIANEVLFPSTKLKVLGGVNNVSDKLVEDTKVTITDNFLVKDKEYTSNTLGNAMISEDGIKLKNSKIKGNLYVKGEDVLLKNTDVKGTIYLDPGRDGEVRLEKVKADKIVVLSGRDEKDGIYLEDVDANLLEVKSGSKVKVNLRPGTYIKKIHVLANTLIENYQGDYKEIIVPKTPNYKELELTGTFSENIIVEGQVELKTTGGAYVRDILIKTDKEDVVILDGKFDDVKVYTGADIKVTEKASARIFGETVKAQTTTEIYVPKGADVRIEKIRPYNVTGDGKDNALN